jgi:hypothetical protein
MSNPGRKETADRSVGLRRLSFNGNFQGVIVEVEIPASSEIVINNPLRSGKQPSGYIIISDRGDGIIKRGNGVWGGDEITFKNISSTSAAEATILVLL